VHGREGLCARSCDAGAYSVYTQAPACAGRPSQRRRRWPRSAALGCPPLLPPASRSRNLTLRLTLRCTCCGGSGPAGACGAVRRGGARRGARISGARSRARGAGAAGTAPRLQTLPEAAGRRGPFPCLHHPTPLARRRGRYRCRRRPGRGGSAARLRPCASPASSGARGLVTVGVRRPPAPPARGPAAAAAARVAAGRPAAAALTILLPPPPPPPAGPWPRLETRRRRCGGCAGARRPRAPRGRGRGGARARRGPAAPSWARPAHVPGRV
jgi:hypothetical protein